MSRATSAAHNESALRDQICAAGKVLYRSGLSPGSSGNISARLIDGYLMTPTGSSLGRLEPDRLSKLDDQGALLSGDRPTKEVPLHLGMYRGRPETAAVIHLHATHAAAISCMDGLDPDDCLPPLTAYYVMKVGRLPLIGYYPPGDPTLGSVVEQRAAKHRALLLANHGPIVGGASIDSAEAVIEELEETAKVFLLLRGAPVRVLSDRERSALENPDG